MSINMMRTIKYRSKENQKYTATYNRANIAIPADALQTDLSESYLAMRLRLMNKEGQTITTDNLKRLIERNLAVSFGHEDFSYTPASMIKSCILKRGNGSIIESIPFSNIISQTMFQLTSNKERVAAKSLLTGVALSDKRGSAVMSTLSSLLKDLVEVQIPLGDIFEVCKSQNFWLSEVGGLEISLEFEDKNTLFKVVPIRSAVENDQDFSEMLYPNNVTLENNMTQAYPSVLFPHSDTAISVADMPRVYEARLFEAVSKEATAVNNWASNQQLQFKEELTEAQIQTRGIEAGRHCKMVFEMESKTGEIPRVVAFENEVVDVLGHAAVGPAVPAVLEYTLSNTDIAAWTGAEAAQYLTGGAEAGDITEIKIKIDPVTGVYTIEGTPTAITTKAYVGGETYIIPSFNLGDAAGVIGVLTTKDCFIQAAAATLGTAPVFTIPVAEANHAADPVPAETPATAAVPATLRMKYAWFAVTDLKFLRLEMEDMLVAPLEIDAAFKLDLTANSIKVPDAFIEKLQEQSIITHDGRANQEATFSLSYQLTYPQAYPDGGDAEAAATAAAAMITDEETMFIGPDIIKGDLATGNGMMALPNTGRGVRLISATPSDEVGFHILKFTNLGCPTSSIGVSLKQAWEGVVKQQTATSLDLIISDYQRVSTALGDGEGDAELVTKLSKGLTYEIDRLEVVLQQSTKNKKIPMGMTYNTYRVEPITIQDNTFDYERQFNIMEASSFNNALLMPKRGSLVSTLPNVYSYRFQVNNIANTSTDIALKTIGSDYSSSLHLDKTLDYFSNSMLPLRNFYGIKGLENTAEPVRILPLKIYTANDKSNYFTNNKPFSVQVALHSPQSALSPIEEGTMYFLKSVLMSL